MLKCDKLSVERSNSFLYPIRVNKEEFLQKLGINLAKIRKKKGVTQEKLASLTDLHRTYIGFIEQGKRNPAAWNLYKISVVLEVDMKDLFSPFESNHK